MESIIRSLQADIALEVFSGRSKRAFQLGRKKNHRPSQRFKTRAVHCLAARALNNESFDTKVCHQKRPLTSTAENYHGIHARKMF
jgi:hypothetical protein